MAELCRCTVFPLKPIATHNPHGIEAPAAAGGSRKGREDQRCSCHHQGHKGHRQTRACELRRAACRNCLSPTSSSRILTLMKEGKSGLHIVAEVCDIPELAAALLEAGCELDAKAKAVRRLCMIHHSLSSLWLSSATGLISWKREIMSRGMIGRGSERSDGSIVLQAVVY